MDLVKIINKILSKKRISEIHSELSENANGWMKKHNPINLKGVALSTIFVARY